MAGSAGRCPTWLRRAAVVGASLLAVGIVGCGGETTATPASGSPHRGGTLTIGLATPPDSLDPHYAPAAVDYRVMRALFDSLVEETPNGAYRPWLATSWNISSDGKTYTFELRKGVTFQDGTPFDAAAVCFNFDRIMSPAEASRYAISLMGPYQSCRAISDSTTEVHFKQPYAPFLSAVSGAFLGMVSPAGAQKYGKDFGMHPVGTGPFSFVSYTLNDSIVLQNYPGYAWGPAGAGHKGSAYLSKLEFHIVPEDATRIGSVNSGDLLSAETVPSQNVAGVKSNEQLHLDTVQTPGAPYQLFINQRHAPWDDVTARRALRQAMNIPSLIKSLYLGTYQQAWGPVAPATVGYDPKVVDGWKSDLGAASKAFDNLGWKTGDDGLRHKGGQTLSVVYMESSPNREKRQDVAQFLSENLRKVGIKVTTQFLPAAPLNNAIQNGQYDIMGLSLVNGDSDVMYVQYYSAFQPGPGRSAFNFAHIESAQLDEWLVQAQQTTNQSRRAQLYAQAQRYVIDNAVSVGVYVPTYTFVTSTKVHGMRYDQQAYPLFYDAWMGG